MCPYRGAMYRAKCRAMNRAMDRKDIPVSLRTGDVFGFPRAAFSALSIADALILPSFGPLSLAALRRSSRPVKLIEVQGNMKIQIQCFIIKYLCQHRVLFQGWDQF